MLLENGFMPQDGPLVLERIRSCLEKNLTSHGLPLEGKRPLTSL
jgi:hypothetical protein